jgi:hypothetical protein
MQASRAFFCKEKAGNIFEGYKIESQASCTVNLFSALPGWSWLGLIEKKVSKTSKILG